MKKRFGIWIDHKQAYVFTVGENSITSTEQIMSEVEPHHKGGINDSEHSTMSSQTKHDERRNNETKLFVKKVIEKINGADELMIFGPSTTKNVLKNTIEDTKSMSKMMVTVNVADTMTENQMRESVRDFFALPKNA